MMRFHHALRPAWALLWVFINEILDKCPISFAIFCWYVRESLNNENLPKRHCSLCSCSFCHAVKVKERKLIYSIFSCPNLISYPNFLTNPYEKNVLPFTHDS